MFKVVLAALMLLFVGCDSGPRMIPQEQLEAILTESLLTDAALNSDSRYGSSVDTVDYYTPILSQRGFTIADLDFTMQQMASRRSNPLSNLFDKVAANINDMALRAAERYQGKVRFDSLAFSFSSDTLYRKDTLRKGKISGYKFLLKKPIVGSYTLKLDYRSTEDYNVGNKSVRVSLGSKDSLPRISNVSWLARSTQKQTPFTYSIEVTTLGYDSLFYQFAQQDFGSKIAMDSDSSYIKNVMVVYTIPRDSARAVYYYHIAPFIEPIVQKYEHRFFFKNDSLPIPFRR
ncbi:MAG: hypothetical protein RR066_07645 [Mucinivorans sp.]